MTEETKDEISVAGFMWKPSQSLETWNCIDCGTEKKDTASGFQLKDDENILLCASCLNQARELDGVIEDVESDLLGFELEEKKGSKVNTQMVAGAKTALVTLQMRLSTWQSKIRKAIDG